MRIGVMLDRVEVGGVEKVAIQQVRALREIGHDACLLVLRRAGGGLEAFADELARIPVRFLEDRLPRRLRASWPVPGFAFLQTFHLTFPLMARRLLREGEVDAILCHSGYTCLTALRAGRLRGVPVAAVIWDPAFHVVASAAYEGRAVGRLRPVLVPLARAFDRWLVRRPGLVVLGGRPYADYVARLGPRRLLISYPAAWRAPDVLPLAERSRDLVAATAWKSGKGPERLLEVIARVPRARLVLAGAWLEPALRERFDAAVRARGLADRVEVTGALSEEALAERYARALAVVQTWSSPGYGLMALEAAANGTTFVIPRGQGSAEVFRDGVDGLLYDLSDEEALVAAVERLVADPGQAVQMGRCAWERVGERASWTARAGELAQELSRMPRPRPRRGGRRAASHG